MRTTKKCCLFKEYFRVVCFVCIKVQNVPPSCSHPFCLYADKMQDKGFQPACLFQRLDLFADMADEIEIEVLQHGGNHHENHVLSHEGKGQMCQLFTLVFPSRFSPPTMIPSDGSPARKIAMVLPVGILCIELVGRNKLVVKVQVNMAARLYKVLPLNA